MRCPIHNYEYDFLAGECPYCAAKERAGREAEQRAELQREANELSARHHEESLAALEAQREGLQELEWQRQSQAEELETQRHEHAEELEEGRRRNHEEALENDRRARIEQVVDSLCRSSERKLAAGRAAEALEDAERALDQAPDHWSALRIACNAAKALKLRAEIARYFGRLVDNKIATTSRWDEYVQREFEQMMCEATSEIYGGEAVVPRLVEAYRGSPADMKIALAAIRRTELFIPWLDTRFRKADKDNGVPKISSLLDALWAEVDDPALVVKLVDQFSRWMALRARFAKWFLDHGHQELALTYLRKCIQSPFDGVAAPQKKIWDIILLAIEAAARERAPNVEQWAALAPAYRTDLAEKLIDNGYYNEALSYLRKYHAAGQAGVSPWEVASLGIEAASRARASADEWVAHLRAALPKYQPSTIPAGALQSKVLSDATKKTVISTMVDHLKKIIEGPGAYRKESGLQEAKAGTASVFSIKAGAMVNRPLLSVHPPLVGTVGALSIWLLPGGHFFDGLKGGVFLTLLAAGIRFLYKGETSEVERSIIGKYCFEYCAVLNRMGLDAKVTSALLRQAPDVNPSGRLRIALGACVLVSLVWYLATSGSSSGDSTASDRSKSHTTAWVGPTAPAVPAPLPAMNSQGRTADEQRATDERRQAAVAAAAAQAQQTRQAQEYSEPNPKPDLATQQVVASSPTTPPPQPEAREFLAIVETGDVQQVTAALSAGADVNAKDARGQSPLFIAALSGHHELVKLLIDHGAEIRARDNEGRTALLIAARTQHAQVVEMLIAAGVDVNAKDATGASAWDLAKQVNDARIIALLEGGGAKSSLAAQAPTNAPAQSTPPPTSAQTATSPPIAAAPASPVATASTQANGVIVTSDEEGGVADQKTACKVWKPNIKPDESVVWSGECQNGFADGPGTVEWSVGDTATLKFEGTYRQGKLEGKGVMTSVQGDRYEGDYKEGMRDGRGIYTAPAGDRYEGEYRENKRHGQGILVSANGDRYEGEFQDNKRNGKGTFTRPNGDKYKGEYKDDKRNGRGVSIKAEGTREEGEFRDGKFIGAAK